MVINRRRFLRHALVGAAGAGLAGSGVFGLRSFAGLTKMARPTFIPADDSPFARVDEPWSSTEFQGDNFSRAHGILWDKETYLREKGGVPAPSELSDVVIAGGGISGLVSAYLLRDLNPVLLEQAPRFGGNSQAEVWGNLEYGVGAAYYSAPTEGSALSAFLQELGLSQKSRFDDPTDQIVMHNGALPHPFWKGMTDPQNAKEFTRIWDEFTEIREEKYPEIPSTADSSVPLAELFAWDNLSFEAWVKKNWGPIHPHIEEFFHEYCWSSLGGA